MRTTVRHLALHTTWHLAPLVFVNTHQPLNGQIFTLVHEFAHVWRGASGIGNKDPRADGQAEIERWCNVVASGVQVPRADRAFRHSIDEAMRLMSVKSLGTFDEYA